jgi:hypothetical protein
LQAIKKLVEEENIDCDFTLTRSCSAFRDQETADKAKAIYEMLVKTGLAYMDDVHFVSGKAAEGVHASPYSWIEI